MGVIGDKKPVATAGGTVLIATVATSASTNNGVSTPAIDTSGATLLSVVVGFDQGSNAPSVFDSKSNTWTALTRHNGALGVSTILYYATNPTVGTGHTFSATSATAIFPGIAVGAFATVNTTSTAFDVENGAFSFGTTCTAGGVTAGSNNELVITGAGLGGGGTTAIATAISLGFTITTSRAVGSTYGVNLAYLKQTTATASDPTWTFDQAEHCATVIAAFKGT